MQAHDVLKTGLLQLPDCKKKTKTQVFFENCFAETHCVFQTTRWDTTMSWHFIKWAPPVWADNIGGTVPSIGERKLKAGAGFLFSSLNHSI